MSSNNLPTTNDQLEQAPNEANIPVLPSSSSSTTATVNEQSVPPTPGASSSVPVFQSSSLYVGDLHPDVYEQQLYDIFNAVGQVASVRVCRDVGTRRSLGYAYVNFSNHSDAERALDTMNYAPINSRPCRVMWSQRDPSLRRTGAGNVFVKNLDPTIDQKALYDTFSLIGNILSCKIVTDREGNSKCYGFVHFEKVNEAEEAIRRVNGMTINGKEIFVGRFVKRDQRPDVNDFTNLYVKNIPKHWSNERFKNLFDMYGKITSCVLSTDEGGKSKGFGFVDFDEHASAEDAIEALHGIELAEDEESETLLAQKKNEEIVEGDADDANETERKPTMISLYVSRAQKKLERGRELTEKHEHMKQSKSLGVNLYVKNLHENVTDEILHQEFSKFGSIISLRVMRDTVEETSAKDAEKKEKIALEGTTEDDKDKNADGAPNDTDKPKYSASKGFGFVCFSNSEEAMCALQEMNDHMLMGKPLKVSLAQNKETRKAEIGAFNHHDMVRAMPMQGGMFAGSHMYPMDGMTQAMMASGIMHPNANIGGGNFGGYMPSFGQMGVNQSMPARSGFAPIPVRGAYPNMPPMPLPNVPMDSARGGRGRGPRGRVNKPGQPSQFAYTNRVRNQQLMQSHVMQPSDMGEMMMPMQPPMAVQAEPPIDEIGLAALPLDARKNLLGSRLYPRVKKIAPERAAKITGMLLEMELPDILSIINDQDYLQSKVKESLIALGEHEE